MATMQVQVKTGTREGIQPYKSLSGTRAQTNTHRKTRVGLWIAQGLLAGLFLFAGSMKLVMPIEMLTAQSPLPGLFLRFIGLCEVLGAIGLILPGIARIRTGLTPLAAAGLVIIMIGATTLTAMTGDVAPALFPLVVGLLSAFVAYGRWRVAPMSGRR